MHQPAPDRDRSVHWTAISCPTLASSSSDHRRTRTRAAAVITPDGDPHAGYADLNRGRCRPDGGGGRALSLARSKPFPLHDLPQQLAEEPFLKIAHDAGRLFTATTTDGMVQLIQVGATRRPRTAPRPPPANASRHYTDNGWMRGRAGRRAAGPISCGHMLKDAAGAALMVTEGISTRTALCRDREGQARQAVCPARRPPRDEILNAVARRLSRWRAVAHNRPTGTSYGAAGRR